MTNNYTKSLGGSITPQGSVDRLRWYRGTFKQASQGVLRAVSRALNNMLTKDRDKT